MKNFKLTIAYDGTGYAGWQRQTSRQSKRTIQEEIESTLQKIFQKKIHLEGSGRTDAGVHALAQVANFKVDKTLQPYKLKKALNGILPDNIAITKVEKVPLSFHARFDVASKTYRYILGYPKTKTAFAHSLIHWIKYPLNVSLMQKETKCLLGRHDFKAFQASDRIERCSKTTIKKISIKTMERGDSFPFLTNSQFIMIDIQAKGFLRNMVRNIVGTLIDIGRGKIRTGELKKILGRKDRRLAGLCAPACGLYLLKVRYE